MPAEHLRTNRNSPRWRRAFCQRARYPQETKNSKQVGRAHAKTKLKAGGTRSGKDARGHGMKARGPCHGRELRHDFLPSGTCYRVLSSEVMWSDTHFRKTTQRATTVMPHNLNQVSFS